MPNPLAAIIVAVFVAVANLGATRWHENEPSVSVVSGGRPGVVLVVVIKGTSGTMVYNQTATPTTTNK